MNKHLCKILMIAYHLAFLGGSSVLYNGYIEEIAKLRTEIVKQADRADKLVTDTVKTSKEAADSVTKSTKELNNSISNIQKEISKIKKACNKFGF